MIGLGLIGEVRRAAAAAIEAMQGGTEADEWGCDPAFVTAIEPLTKLLYERWWRVTTTGAEHVPATGRVLLVANQAGVLPWDAAMVGAALRRAGRRDDLRFLVYDWALELPWASVAIRRSGGVASSPFNAVRLLEQDHALLAFPEGVAGPGKRYGERYRVQRFGRGEVAELALRTGATIVPVGIVGSEEIYPKLAELPGAARLLGAPHMPLTPTFPLLGPLGAVPLPARWRIAFGAPVDLSHLGPEAAEDRATLLEIADDLRARVQALVHANLVARRRTFL